ncbi:DUF2963 domain-containing protein [Candidatus Phytoplasma sp. AldY-WA1]|uniref:DUF2963 domain-containing protein n=1 Tax=Candidatus Phytoplasma sp. AldY-WA1 TaxID=2852100 RepID=UPI00254FF165|nr:DUF2963 domain-containing protein [Candidatus Phytoplasma sp. AldY-WA1]
MKTNKTEYKVIKEYNNNGQLIRQINYRSDGRRIYRIDEFNKNKNNQKIYYLYDGKTIFKTEEFNENSKLIKEIIM